MAKAKDTSAKDLITGFLTTYGLGSLGEWAWAQYLAGATVDQIMLEIREHPTYKARFPAMEALAQRGNAISESAYVEYEITTRRLLQQWGVTSGLYDTPDRIANLLINSVSASEINDRLQLAASAAYQSPPEVRQALQDRFHLQGGDFVSFYLDPDRALPLIQQQYQSAQVMGAARQQQVGINDAEADRLALNGVSFEQAQQGFGQVAATERLAYGSGEVIAQDQRVRAAFGDAAAAMQQRRVQASRAARFQGGGNAAETQEGVTGLGRSGSR